MNCIMTTNAKDASKIQAESSSSSSSGIFSRQSIHFFLDKLMDMFLMDSSNSNKNDVSDSSNFSNVEPTESGAAVFEEKNTNSKIVHDEEDNEKKEGREEIETHYSNNSSVNEQYVLQRPRSSFRNKKRRSTSFDGRESYDEADDSSVEDSLQDYQFVVGGMNMSRFGGVFGASGAGNTSTSSGGCVSAVSGRTMSSVLTAVTERTDEEDCASVATAYRLGRTSCSSSQQQQQILSQLSSLSQAFLRTTKTNSFATPAAAAAAAAGQSLPTSPTASVVSQKQQQVAACAASRRSTQSTGEETEDDENGAEKQISAVCNVVAESTVDKLEFNLHTEVEQM